MEFNHIDLLDHRTLEQLERFTLMPIVVFNEKRLLYSNVFYQDAINEEKIDDQFNNLYHDIDHLNPLPRQEIRVKNSFGETFYFDIQIKRVIYEKKPALFAILLDITDRKSYIKKVDEFTKLRELIIEISDSILNITDIDSFYSLVLNTTLKALDKSTLGTILVLDGDHFYTAASVGYSEDVSTFKLPLDQSFIYHETQGKLNRIVKIDDATQLSNYIPVTTVYGEEVFIHSTLSAPIFLQGVFYGLINVDSLHSFAFDDDDVKSIEFISKSIEIAITNRLLYEEKSYLSRFDRITKLYNRHFFDEHCDVVIKRAQRYSESFHLVMIDIDNLKAVNDKYSHLVGDEIIILVSNLLKQSIRESDVFARYGGDEFVGLLFNANCDLLYEKFELLNEELKKSPIEYQGSMVYSSMSYGIASFNEDGSTIYELIRVADERMYKYKSSQKDQNH
ncbi:MAG: diguanylate cyclase [Erysipelothrix sp.]|jgi:diguanylate cyclase (GGDEF)-like protein|nr:diguanylate cyclase [Erysipelothrix sp.]